MNEPATIGSQPLAEPKKPKTWFWLSVSLAVAAAAMLLDFAVLGVYQYQGDTPTYVASVEFYGRGAVSIGADDDKRMIEFRLLKPVYGLAGSLLSPIMEPHQSILFLNLLSFYGTVVLLFFILMTLGFSAQKSALGTTWFSFGYPVLKYGFSLITDISGYFFIALTCYLALLGFKKKQLSWFLWAGAAAAVGALSKESGALGLLFIFGGAIAGYRRLGWRFAVSTVILAGGVFGIIYLPIQVTIMRYIGYSFFDFFGQTQKSYYEDYPAHLFYVLIHAATFHILWLYAALGTIGWLKDKRDMTWLGAWLVGVPTILWLMYVTRYAFVYYIAVIPFALYGLDHIFAIFTGIPIKTEKRLRILLATVPCLINIGLLIGAKSGAYLNFLLK